MAIFHAAIKSFSRARSHSATAAAAYRAGLRLSDDRTGEIHDYTRRDGVAHVRHFLPISAPNSLATPTALWNAAEHAETRVNSRVARELEVSLPAELSTAQREDLSHALAQMLVDRYAVAVMAAVHEPSKGGDSRNHHVHLLMTTRVLGPTGFGEKVRVLDDQKTGPVEIATLRSMTADLINRHLEAAGRPERVDHRTLSEQAGGAAARGDIEGVARLCRVPGSHHGKAATALLRRGQFSDRATAARHSAPSTASRWTRSQAGKTPTTRLSLGDTGLSLRAHGADARLLNEQATLIQRGLRHSRDSLRVYLEGLNQAAREAEEGAIFSGSPAAALRSDDFAYGQSCAGDGIDPIHEKPLSRRVSPANVGNVHRPSADQPSGGIDRPTRVRKSSRWPLTTRQWAERRRAERAANAVVASVPQAKPARAPVPPTHRPRGPSF